MSTNMNDTPAPNAEESSGAPAVLSPLPLRRSPWHMLRVAFLVVVPLLAIGVAWWFTRPEATAHKASDSADHGAMGMTTGDSARSVMIDSASARRIGVTFAPVMQQSLGREVRAVGQVIVDETRVRTVTVKVDGWIEQLFVDYTGQLMTSGAPLLSMYSPTLVTVQEELLLARQLTRDVATSTAEMRESATGLAEAARRRLRWWDVSDVDIARIERAGSALRAVTMYAPVGGVVLEKIVTVGQRVIAGDPLYRVADLSSVWVDGDVYERDLRAIRVGQLVKATFDALPGVQLNGRVTYVYPTLSSETRTARVRVSLPNHALQLRPGMYATLRIVSDDPGVTLSVPRGAVIATGERQLVFVRHPDGMLEARTVEIGATSDKDVEILSGVALGDTVVASATFLVDAESSLGSTPGSMANMPGMTSMPPARSPARPPERSPERSPARPPTLSPVMPPARPPAPMPTSDSVHRGGPTK